MDRLKMLFEKYLNELNTESKNKLERLPDWKLNSYLSNFTSNNMSKTEKIKHIQEKFLLNDKVYTILKGDLEKIKSSTFDPTFLKILTIDDRLLESSGYSENMKERVYSFISEVEKLIG